MGCFYKVIIGVNFLLFVISAVIVGFSAVTIYNFDRSVDSFFTRGDFAWFLVAGLIGIGISFMACLGARNPMEHYNLLFCYFFMLSLLLMLLSFAFYLYRIFVNNLEATADGNIESAVRIESAKEFNDFLLSVYVACCSTCLQSLEPNCIADLEQEPGFEDCDVATLGAASDPDDVANLGDSVSCLIPKLCGEDEFAENEGLDKGCFIGTQVIPPYEISNNVCIFFSEFATTQDGDAIVGPLNEKGCGEGDPRVFVQDVFSFISKNRALIYAAWIIGILVSVFAWLGALFILTCPDRYSAGTGQLI